VSLSPAQRGAIHLHCEHLSKALKGDGVTVQELLSKSVERSWTLLTIKDMLWKDLAMRLYGVESTEDLTPPQITEIYDIINKFTSTNWGIHVPFPSMESLEEKRQGGGNL